METEYRKDLQHKYLVIRLDEGTNAFGYCLRMLDENDIEGLLPCSLRHIDDRSLLYYDVTSRISLQELCKFRKLTGAEILRLLRCFISTCLQLEEYLLPADMISLSPLYIYTDAGADSFLFCWIPEAVPENAAGIREFLEEILPLLDHKSGEGMMEVYDLYQYCMEEQVTMEGLQGRLEAHERKASETTDGKTEKKSDDNQGQNYAQDGNYFRDMDLDAEEVFRKKQQHQQALNDFFAEDEEDGGKERHPVLVTLSTVLICLYLLTGWYLLRNRREFFSIWGGAGLVFSGIAVLAILWKTKRKDNAEDDSENDMFDSFAVESGLPDGISPSGTFTTYRGKRKQEEDTEFDRDSFFENPPPNPREHIQEEEFTQLLRPPKTGDGSFYLEEQYPERGRRIPLEKQGVQTIGRPGSKADIQLPSQAVSRLHAWIRLEGGCCYLRDLNSKNGTWVNGEELTGEEERMLQAGDEIRFAEAAYFLQNIQKQP